MTDLPLGYWKRPITQRASIVIVVLAAVITVLVVAVLSSGSSAQILLGSPAVASTPDGGAYPGSEAFGYTATASGTAGSISVYLDSADGAMVGLYADSSRHHPGVLLAHGSVTSNSPGWVNIPIANVTVTTATRYWIALGSASSGGTIGYRDTGNSGSSLDYSGTGFANPYSVGGRWSSNPVSAYVVAAGSTTSSTSTTGSPPVNTGLPVITGSIFGGRS
jgi:hypothetical protein